MPITGVPTLRNRTEREEVCRSPSSKRNVIGLAEHHIIVLPSRFVHFQYSLCELPQKPIVRRSVKKKENEHKEESLIYDSPPPKYPFPPFFPIANPSPSAIHAPKNTLSSSSTSPASFIMNKMPLVANPVGYRAWALEGDNASSHRV